jgi:hypothetical protein
VTGAAGFGLVLFAVGSMLPAAAADTSDPASPDLYPAPQSLYPAPQARALPASEPAPDPEPPASPPAVEPLASPPPPAPKAVVRSVPHTVSAPPAPEAEAVVPAAARAATPRQHPKPPPPAPRHESLFVSLIPRPSDVSWSPGHVGFNLSITFALVLLLGLPAELLNSSIKVRAVVAPHRRRLRLGWLAAFEARLATVPDPLLLIGFSAAAALVYSQLDPGVGFDGESALFVGALAMALIVVTGVLEVVRIPYLRRRHNVTSHLQLFPRAFAIAALLVVVSRLTGFHPGFIFGITCGLAISGRLRDADEGRSIAIACAVLLAVAALAWIVWIPASTAAAADHPSTLAVISDTFLATLWVTGLQVVLFGLLPLRFLYGEKVMSWSRIGWLALYGTAVFLFVQTIFHPGPGVWGGLSSSTMAILGLAGIALLIFSIAYWLWARRTTAPPPEPPGPEPELVLVG